MTEPLPGILAEIAEVAGTQAALAVAARVGGTRVYIAARLSDDHWLVECLGRAKADAIAARLGGGHVDVPLGVGGAYRRLRRAIAERVHELDQAGASASAIARRTGVTERTVFTHRAAHRGGKKSGKQGRLL